jgi:hypothetical protein
MSVRSDPQREPSSEFNVASALTVDAGGLEQYVVREEDPDEFWDEAMRAGAQTRSGPTNLERFARLCRSNPDGPAVLWSVREVGSRRIAGFRAAFPCHVRVDGERRVAWNGGDFWIDPRLQGLAVAVKLDRVIKDGVDAGRADFFYTFPTERMQIIHDRVGFQQIGTVVRLVRPLRRNGGERGGLTRWLPEGSRRLGDAVHSWRSAERRHRLTLDVRRFTTVAFDEGFDRLFEAIAATRRVIAVRDQRHLSWRYGQDPQHPTEGVVVEQGGTPKGYALFRSHDGIGRVKDILAADDQALPDLVVALVRSAEHVGLRALEARVDERNPVLPVLEAFGFVRDAESEAVYAYAPQRTAIRTALLAGETWLLALGDRDA